MNTATDNRRSVAAILDALETQLEAVQWNGRAAFDSVKRFDVASLADAFHELLETKQRVCFIVPDDEVFEPQLRGQKILLTRKLPVALLVSDRVLGSRYKALWGDGDNTPGAMALAELALPAVTGQLLAKPNGVVALPTRSAVLFVTDDKSKLPGRSCVELDLECTGGTLETTTTNGPNL